MDEPKAFGGHDRFSIGMKLLSAPTKAESMARTCLMQQFPEFAIPPNFEFHVQPDPVDSGYWRIETNLTNLDCELLSQIISVRSRKPRGITPSYFVNEALDAVSTALLASSVGGDIAPGIALDPLVTLLISDAVQSCIPASELELFEDSVLGDAGAIARAVTTGGKSFLELAEILEKKQRFSSWLRDIPPDRKVTREYIKYLKDGSWLDRFSGRAARCAVFTGAGLVTGALLAGPVGAAAGAGLGIFDGLILDRIREGWHPNQFVEGPLSDFAQARRGSA